MEGKRERRERRRKWTRAPAVLMMLLVSAEVLTPAAPVGALPESPAEQCREVALASAAVPDKRSRPRAEPLEEASWTPVAESEAVEDTYFEDAVFLGDSRTEGLLLYSNQ